jgi:D-aspartate ligase
VQLPPSAVVVGLCAHGLCIVRSLHAAQVKVIAFEANKNLPGTRTRRAKIHFVPDINGPALVDSLVDFATASGFSTPPVLFLTNDRMIETVGTHAERLAGKYRLSWASSRAALLPLLRKDRIEGRCAETGLNYPKTRLIADLADLTAAAAHMRFPLIAKPIKPISSFKTLVIDSAKSLDSAGKQLSTCLPVILQEFIAGDDRSIRFGALYLKNGEPLARFEGRKLRSRPMGHTTVAVAERNDAIHELAKRFFDGLSLSGPVSLELKRGPDGSEWVIEPTVGRSDFWVGLCIANGVDLPLIEFQSEVGSHAAIPAQRDTHIWFNGERDPGALFWTLMRAPDQLFGRKVRGVYADAGDPSPWGAAVAKQVAALPGRAMRKLGKLLTP